MPLLRRTYGAVFGAGNCFRCRVKAPVGMVLYSTNAADAALWKAKTVFKNMFRLSRFQNFTSRRFNHFEHSKAYTVEIELQQRTQSPSRQGGTAGESSKTRANALKQFKFYAKLRWKRTTKWSKMPFRRHIEPLFNKLKWNILLIFTWKNKLERNPKTLVILIFQIFFRKAFLGWHFV